MISGGLILFIILTIIIIFVCLIKIFNTENFISEKQAQLIKQNKDLLEKQKSYNEFKMRIPDADAVLYSDAKDLYRENPNDFTIEKIMNHL